MALGFVELAGLKKSLREPEPRCIGLVMAKFGGSLPSGEGLLEIFLAEKRASKIRPARFVRFESFRLLETATGFALEIVRLQHQAELSPSGALARSGAHVGQGSLDQGGDRRLDRKSVV